jgi:type VI secretion system secreted protein VgrG
MGNITQKADLGAVTVEAMQSITFKVGASSVKIDQMGVTIKGMMVKIQGDVMLDMKGLMTTVKGDAMLTLKGAITMIN